MRAILVILSLLFSFSVCAQSSLTQTTEGVVGLRDKGRRNPVLSVTKVIGAENVKLLVDAHIPREDTRKFPIQFDFYVNRHHFVSQVRSDELPGPVGVSIGRDIAAPPFNFTVIATVLHPSRTFRTVMNGAVFNEELSGVFACSLTFNGETYSNDEVVVNQLGNDQVQLAFVADSSSGSQVSVSGTVNILGETANSDLSVVESDTAQVLTLSGSASVVDSSLASFSVTDETNTLSCN